MDTVRPLPLALRSDDDVETEVLGLHTAVCREGCLVSVSQRLCGFVSMQSVGAREVRYGHSRLVLTFTPDEENGAP